MKVYNQSINRPIGRTGGGRRDSGFEGRTHVRHRDRRDRRHRAHARVGLQGVVEDAYSQPMEGQIGQLRQQGESQGD